MAKVKKIKIGNTSYSIEQDGPINVENIDSTGNLGKFVKATTTGSDWSTITAADINSGSATSGKVLTADGSGSASWQNATLHKYTHTFNDTMTSSDRMLLNRIYKNAVSVVSIKDGYANNKLLVTIDANGINLGCIEFYGSTIYFKQIYYRDDGTTTQGTLTYIRSGSGVQEASYSTRPIFTDGYPATITYWSDTEIT